jgi:hypothetical protein
MAFQPDRNRTGSARGVRLQYGGSSFPVRGCTQQPDISIKIKIFRPGEHGVADALGLHVQFACALAQDEVRQDREVLAPFTPGRQAQLADVEAVKPIRRGKATG